MKTIIHKYSCGHIKEMPYYRYKSLKEWGRLPELCKDCNIRRAKVVGMFGRSF